MSASDRVKTAAEATAASVRQIHPLTLPENTAVTGEPGEHGGRPGPRLGAALARIKETWIIPLAAAAAVAALALALVTLRHAEAPAPATTNTGTPAPRVAGIPRYYAIANVGKPDHYGRGTIIVTIADAYTGKTIATVPTPTADVGQNTAIAGLSAAADDRTFVVGGMFTGGGATFYLLHIAPGAKPVATIKPLPMLEVAMGKPLGLAVSPDGKELAILSIRYDDVTLQIYSVASGAVLRTWVAGSWKYQGDGIQQTGVSWTADGRQVAFSTTVPENSYGSVLEERIVAATAPSGDLAAASKLLLRAPGDCSSLLLTPDGETVVCATLVNYPRSSSSSAVCGKDGPLFVAYSAATGARLRILNRYTGACAGGVNTVLWSDDSARHVIGEQYLFQSQVTDRYGVAAAGEFSEFPVAQHAQSYAGPAF